MKDVFKALPWWVRWIALPVAVLIIFGGMVTWLIGLVFKILLTVAAIAVLVFLVRKFFGASKSSGSNW